MDEVFCKINDKRIYLWYAVDQDGQAIDEFSSRKKDRKMVSRFI